MTVRRQNPGCSPGKGLQQTLLFRPLSAICAILSGLLRVLLNSAPKGLLKKIVHRPFRFLSLGEIFFGDGANRTPIPQENEMASEF